MARFIEVAVVTPSYGEHCDRQSASIINVDRVVSVRCLPNGGCRIQVDGKSAELSVAETYEWVRARLIPVDRRPDTYGKPLSNLPVTAGDAQRVTADELAADEVAS